MCRISPRSLLMVMMAALLIACKQAPEFNDSSNVNLPYMGEPTPDVDAMAARMKTGQDLYKKIRDDALAEYARQSPSPAPFDDKAKAVIRLYAYLWVWSDVYGECLGGRGEALAWEAQKMGCKDLILQAFMETYSGENFHSETSEQVATSDAWMQGFLSTNYPPALKLYACEASLSNMVGFEEDAPAGTEPLPLSARKFYVDQWGRNYRELLKQGLPHTQLFLKGEHVMYVCVSDEKVLDLLVAEQERDFNEVDPQNPVRTELDGLFEIEDAWNARGSDWADKVTPGGSSLFAQRLKEAKAILEPIYVKSPGEMGTCLSMLKVVLDDGDSPAHTEMETWFQRAIAIDPDSEEAYLRKEWYLQPRWDGSEREVLDFGRQCVQGGNWPAKIPMILTKASSNIAENDPIFYHEPGNWQEVEAVYREYLKRYPMADDIRTWFALHAYDSDHYDTALEEFKILGNDWDRLVLDWDKYGKIKKHLRLP